MALTPPLKLTRDQLASFLQDHEQIRQFENLFAIVQAIAPDLVQASLIAAGNAQASANDALAQILTLANDAAINAGNADQKSIDALAQIASLAKDASINSGNAEQKAIQALDTLGRIANALELIATSPVIQNNNSVVTDYIDLPEDGPHVTQARRVQWNADDGTVDIGLYNGSVLQVGQELMYYAKNTSGGTINNGTPVMFTGTVGASSKLEFGLAVANGSVPADYMMGVATQDIANNAFGYVTSFGVVRGFNTTGTPYGEVWADGDLLYFDPATPGTWTNIQPQAPNINVPVAVVLNAGPGGSGSIFVRMTIDEALSRLQDVFISSPTSGQLVIYDAVQARWENANLTAGANITITNGAGSITIAVSGLGTMAFENIGVSGSFTAASGETITVTNGIITSIV